MPIKADCHLHSYFSGDSNAPMEEMVQKGISLGLTHMCFTEHMDPDYVYTNPEDQGIFELNTDSYLYELATMKSRYKEQIHLLFGVELGLQPHLKRELAVYAKSFPFDFIIASSHLCNRKDPYYPAFYEGRSDEEAYREFFEATLENIKTFDNYDVFGHLDYVVRYGKTKDAEYSYDKYKDILDRILEELLLREKGIELNTGAIGYSLKELNPCTEILRRYRQLGGEIVTIGSDAHSPSALANGFDRARHILADCGFQYYAVFENRMPEFYRI